MWRNKKINLSCLRGIYYSAEFGKEHISVSRGEYRKAQLSSWVPKRPSRIFPYFYAQPRSRSQTKSHKSHSPHLTKSPLDDSKAVGRTSRLSAPPWPGQTTSSRGRCNGVLWLSPAGGGRVGAPAAPGRAPAGAIRGQGRAGGAGPGLPAGSLPRQGRCPAR